MAIITGLELNFGIYVRINESINYNCGGVLNYCI